MMVRKKQLDWSEKVKKRRVERANEKETEKWNRNGIICKSAVRTVQSTMHAETILHLRNTMVHGDVSHHVE